MPHLSASHGRSLAPLHRLSSEPLVSMAWGYGWWLDGSEPEKGRELMERIVDGPCWPAFGFLAAEAELAGNRE